MVQGSGEVWSTKLENPDFSEKDCVDKYSKQPFALCDEYPELVSTDFLGQKVPANIGFSFGIKYSWTIADEELKKAVAAAPK